MFQSGIVRHTKILDLPSTCLHRTRDKANRSEKLFKNFSFGTPWHTV